MKRVFKIIFIATGMVMGSLLILVIIYDIIIFKYYQPNIEVILRNSPSFYKNPSKELLDIVNLSEGDRIKTYVAQMSLISLGRNKNSMLKWHTEYALWTLLIGIHLDNSDIFVLWCHFAPYEKGIGLNESANFYYGKDVDKLDTKEIASIIARVKAPLYYKDHPHELKIRVNELLSKYSASLGQQVGLP